MNQQPEPPSAAAAAASASAAASAAASSTEVVISNSASQSAIGTVSQSLQAAILRAAEQINASLQAGEGGGTAATDVHSAAVSQLSASSTVAKLEMAKQLAKQIGEKTAKPAVDSNILNPATALSRLAAAKLSADKLNARLGYRPSPGDPAQAPVGPLTLPNSATSGAGAGTSAGAQGTSSASASASAHSEEIDDEAYMEKLRVEALEKQRIEHQQQRFNAEMEINDFPDYIRFKLTMRVNIIYLLYIFVCLT